MLNSVKQQKQEENHPLLFSDRPCNGIEVGRVKNNENPRLEELSGLAESHRYKDVFYSIEDSGNENVVYVINKNGTLKGLNISNQY